MSDMNMLCVPGGPFLMSNSGTGDDVIYGYPREYPQHLVDLPTFWISKCEVTRGQFNQFVVAGGYSNASLWSGEGWAWKLSVGRTHPGYWDSAATWQEKAMPHVAVGSFSQTDNHPVVGISSYEPEAFCTWAGGRLPTEAEWGEGCPLGWHSTDLPLGKHDGRFEVQRLVRYVLHGLPDLPSCIVLSKRQPIWIPRNGRQCMGMDRRLVQVISWQQRIV